MSDPDIQRIFRAVPGLFLLLRPDADFSIIAASADYLNATHTDESIFGRPLFEVFSDDPSLPEATGQQNLRASLERVVAARLADTMAVQRYDIRSPHSPDGGFEERYWLPINSPVLKEDGSIDFIVHRVEEASAKANRNAIDTLESITEGFFTLDRHWRFDYVNREAHRILGVEPGSLAGQVVWQAYPGLEGTAFEKSYHHSMHAREKSSVTAFYDRHQRWYDVTTFPATEGISVFFRDVTEQKNLQAERDQLAAQSERQRRMYEAALDSTLDFFYVFDLEHRVLYANAALRNMWGVDAVRGKRWLELGYESWHADLHDRELDQVIATRAPLRGEIPFTGTNGRRVYEYIFAPVLGEDNQVVAVAGTTRDITERQAIEQAVREQSSRLAQADRVKDEFLATLSHELRNPLAALRNAVELLRRMGPADEVFSNTRAMMERQVMHLVRLVDDLLEMSRISRGTISLQKERLELGQVIRHAVESSVPAVKAGGHTVQIELPKTALFIEGDQVRVTQILTNLLNNAATYSEKPGCIRIGVRVEGQEVAIHVSDEGIGLAADALERLFEMFNRGDRDSRRNQGGLGIGLALSRRLAHMHGGALQASSAGIGKGSTFTLRLPLAPAPVAAGRAAPAKTEGASLGGLRVLVIDDNRDAATGLAQLLRTLGAAVRVAHSGPAGLDLFSAEKPSVVLLDIGMPGMNGYEVAREIRERFQATQTLLIALTGWTHEDDRAKAKAAGFDHHLAKPADIDALQQLLATSVR